MITGEEDKTTLPAQSREEAAGPSPHQSTAEDCQLALQFGAAASGLICPVCLGACPPADHRGWLDRLWSLLGRSRWECPSCRLEFYAWRGN
jgi:hypothetical protein